ncbi:MAG: aldehyde dehydrogenase [Mucilaginibacter sp.]|nr:aldehyde dehydrogenase [Mucilaginibacter sp.]
MAIDTMTENTELEQHPVAMHWIDGEWVDSAEHGRSINPATGDVIGMFAKGTKKETAEAVDAALCTFNYTEWKENPQLRSRVLNELADRFEVRANDIIQLLATENGKILPEAGFEVSITPAMLRYYAALTLTEHGRAAEWKTRKYFYFNS